MGKIAKSTYDESVYWEYEYDDRYRLITADRYHASGNVRAQYAYSYDDPSTRPGQVQGDNMITPPWRVEPFMDDFNDDASTGWSKTAGFAAANTMMVDSNTDPTVDTISKDDFTDDDHEIRFSYRRTSSNSGDRVSVYARFVDWDNYVRVEFFANNTCRVLEKVNGTASIIATGTAASTTNTWYDVRIVCDDTSVRAYHKTGQNLESQVLSATSPVTTSSKVAIVTWSNTTADIDNIWLIGDSLSNTTTFAVNNANELTTMTDPNGTTTFAFDPWGRMTSESRESLEAMYEYNYGQMLIKLQTNFPGASGVEYQYRADGVQRSITENNEVRLVKYGRKGRILNEEDSASNLLRTFIADLAHVDGNDPAEGTITFNGHDVLRSVRSGRTQSKSLVQFLEFSPFGAILFSKSVTADSPVFAGLTTRNTSGTAHARLRFHFPRLARWSSRDPLSMLDGPNLYSYARNNPVSLTDPLGLSTSNVTFYACMLPNLMTSPLPLPTINDVRKNVAEACHMTYWEWREKVTKGGEWDYYSTYMRNCPEYVITFGHGDYLEEISNYNMGATGYAVGIDYAWLFLASIVLHFLDYRLLHWNNERKDCTDIGRGYVDANKWLMSGEVVP